jgi:hypothetical protein
VTVQRLAGGEVDQQVLPGRLDIRDVLTEERLRPLAPLLRHLHLAERFSRSTLRRFEPVEGTVRGVGKDVEEAVGAGSDVADAADLAVE